jgi:hypothetical protein
MGNILGSYKFYVSKQKKLIRRQWDKLQMPRPTIKHVDRHVRQDKATSRLTFSDRNKRSYVVVANEEYNDQQEGLVEEDPSTFPDILSVLPGVELLEHCQEVTIMTDQDQQAKWAMQACIAADNAGLGGDDMREQGPHRIEADQEVFDEDDSIVAVTDTIPTAPEDAIEMDDGSVGLDDHGAAFDPEDELSGPEGDLLYQATAGEGQHKAPGNILENDQELDAEGKGKLPRWSKQKQKISSTIDRFEHNMFSMYSHNHADKEVDEYVHATLSEDKCDEIDSYLVPIFEFIVTQYSLKAGLKKAKGKDKKAMWKMMGENLMT